MNDNLMKKYDFRPATIDDLETIAGMMDAQSMELRGTKSADLDELRTDYGMEGFSFEEDALMAFDKEGNALGYVDVWCADPPYVKQWVMVLFDKSVRGDQELVDAFGAWALERAKRNLGKAPEGTKVVMTTGVDELNEWKIEMLKANGYEFKRNFAKMQIDLDEEPSEPVWPEGITLKTWEWGVEDRAVYDAVEDAFKDHWGHVSADPEEDFKKWLKYRTEDPHFNPELNLLVMDGDEIAGFSLCKDYVPEDETLAIVGGLGVRRPWRKRGLGLAMLKHCFREARERGKKGMVLYVDTDSLTNAFRLYEKAGMHRGETHQVYQYLVREGEDLATNELN